MAEQLMIICELPFDSYGETYRACRGADRDLYVRISDICEAMGLALATQLRRIRNTYVVSHKLTYIEVNTPYQEGTRLACRLIWPGLHHFLPRLLILALSILVDTLALVHKLIGADSEKFY